MIHWKKFLQNIPEKIIGIYAQDMVLYLTQLVRKEDGWQVGRSCCFSFAPDETADWNEQVMEQVKVICMKEHLSCQGSYCLSSIPEQVNPLWQSGRSSHLLRP